MRNRDPLIDSDFGVKPLRGAVALVAKKQAIAIGVGDLPKALRRLGRQEPQPLGPQRTRPESIPVGVLMNIQGPPIVHACATKMAIRDLKTERVDQVKAGARQGTKPAHIARVLGNLGIEKDKMQHPLMVER